MSFVFIILTSCSNNKFNSQISGRWNMLKKEKFVKVSSYSYAPVKLDIPHNLYYHFLDNSKVVLNTDLGYKHRGNWFIKDSTLTIDIKKETQEFKIQKLTSDTLLLLVHDIRLTFEKIE